jgi:hypothetical protein
MTQKALLQSAGDGTTVPAGYVGETIEAIGTSVVSGSTTAGTFTTLLTLSNVPSGKWKFDFTVPLIDINGQSGDGASFAAGRVVAVSIFKNGSEIQRFYCPGMAKSTVNGGYLITAGCGYLIESKSTTDTYDLRYTTINNSSTPTITQSNCSATSINPIKFTATRIA